MSAREQGEKSSREERGAGAASQWVSASSEGMELNLAASLAEVSLRCGLLLPLDGAMDSLSVGMLAVVAALGRLPAGAAAVDV